MRGHASKRGRDILLLSLSMIMYSQAPSHSPKIETERAETSRPIDIKNRLHNVVMHLPSVKRVRVGHHHPSLAREIVQESLQFQIP
jgi:hypothetical protein